MRKWQTVAIVGAGLIGRSWAIVFARAGWEVRVADPEPRARSRPRRGSIREALDELAGARPRARSGARGGARHGRRSRSRTRSAGVDYVQENGPELRRGRSAQSSPSSTAARRRDAILASSTSAIVASRFTEELAGRARCLVAHPSTRRIWCRVVELCGAPWTSPRRIGAGARDLRERRPGADHVKREIDGFVMNRLQGALLDEAFRLVGDGYVRAEDLDMTLARRPRPALVLHGAVRDHRSQCARRHRRLCAPLSAASAAVSRRPAAPRRLGRAKCATRRRRAGAKLRRRDESRDTRRAGATSAWSR